jgi:hypothetical protein
MTDDLAFVDHIGMVAFFESKDFKQQVEEYSKDTGINLRWSWGRSALWLA